jgi:hypothetical protein
MTGIFAITSAITAVRLDARRMGDLVFTVVNHSGCALRARFTPRPRDGRSSSWLSVDGATERMLEDAAVEPVRVRIAVSEQAAAGLYAFRLEVVGVANPDELVGEGPWVDVTVAEVPALRRAFPWWMLLFAASGLALCGSGIGMARADHELALLLAILAVVLAICGIAVLVNARSKRMPSVAVVPTRAPLAAVLVQAPAVGVHQVASVASAASTASTASATSASVVISGTFTTVVAAATPAKCASGRIHCAMPRLVGWTQADACAALSALGVPLGRITDVDSTAAPGTVLDQRPSDGQPITDGQAIDLVIARSTHEAPGQPPHASPADPGVLT